MMWELVRQDPLTGFVSLQEEMNRLFSGFWGRSVRRGAADGLLWTPSIDVEESQDEVVVKAELPGMDRDGITLQVHADTLTISGERRRESETKDKTTHLVERAYGRFQRVIGLPAGVEGSRATASYEQGVLTIRLPKAEQAKPKEIAIDVK